MPPGIATPAAGEGQLVAIQHWNDNILLLQPQPEPGLGEELREVYAMVVQQDEPPTVIADMQEISQLTSTHLSILLKLRRALIEKQQSLILCNVQAVLWGVFLVTGLDVVFRFAADVMTALTTVQLQQQKDCDPPPSDEQSPQHD